MDQVDQIEDLMHRVASRWSTFHLLGACTLESIEKVEKALGVKFPPSYKQFCLRYGGGGPYPGISGVDPVDPLNANLGQRVLGDTIRTREDYQIPRHLAVIYRDYETGSIWCLDTSKADDNGECPVASAVDGIIQASHPNFEAFLIEYLRLRAKR
jgi:antitoxin YobK